MRIPDDGRNASTQRIDNRIADQKRSDRFAQLLKKDNRDRDGERFQHAVDNKEKSKVLSELQPGNADLMAMSSDPMSHADSQDPPVVSGSFAADSRERVEQIEKVATEIGSQVDFLKANGKAEAADITFSSRVLDGLQVQIRRQQGTIAINFVSPSDSIRKLISQHSGELREALSNKGVKLGNLTISANRKHVWWEGARNVDA